MFLVHILLSLGVAFATGASRGSIDQSDYYSQLLKDYAERAPQRWKDGSIYARPRDLGPAAFTLFINLPTAFFMQTRGDRESVFNFFGELIALGIRHDLDRSSPDLLENEYRRDLRRLMVSSPELKGIPQVLRPLVLFARPGRAVRLQGAEAVATAALDVIVGAVVDRANRADTTGADLTQIANLLGYIGTPAAHAAMQKLKVVVLRPICDPLFAQ